MFIDNVLNTNIKLYLFIFLKRNLLNENIGLKNLFDYMISSNDDDFDLTVNILNQVKWKNLYNNMPTIFEKDSSYFWKTFFYILDLFSYSSNNFFLFILYYIYIY